MLENPGNDTVGIVTLTDTGQVDSKNKPITSESVVWVDGCEFQMQHISERQEETITSHERAWAWLPYNATTAAINNANFLRPKRPDPLAQRDYKVYGRPFILYHDGEPDHVFVICEYQAG